MIVMSTQEQISLVSSCWCSGSLPESLPFLKSMMALFEPMKAFQPDIHLPSYRCKRGPMPPLGRWNFVFVRKAAPSEIRFAVPAEISRDEPAPKQTPIKP